MGSYIKSPSYGFPSYSVQIATENVTGLICIET